MVTNRGPYLIESIKCSQDCFVSIVNMFHYKGPEIVVVAWAEEDETEGQILAGGGWWDAKRARGHQWLEFDNQWSLRQVVKSIIIN